MANKTKPKEGFSEEDMRSWEGSDGVNFAIALARITGWILHVDWWSATDDKELVENMKSLRVHVGNNTDQIYDVRGKRSIAGYHKNIVEPIFNKRGKKYGGIVTRYYSENAIFNLPLRIKPDEARITKAMENIKNNVDFLEKIPKRGEPMVPAYVAAKYTFGYCAPFAEALSDLKGYKSMAMIAKEYSKLFGYSKLGYVHSFTFDENNNAIDIWGRDEIENIAQRFGVTKFELDVSMHEKTIRNHKKNSPEKYKMVYEESVQIVNDYF